MVQSISGRECVIMPVSGQPQPIMIVGALILIALVGFLFLKVVEVHRNMP